MRWPLTGGSAVRAWHVAALAGAAALALAAVAGVDFGLLVQSELNAQSVQQFGIVEGVAESSTLSTDAASASANPLALATFR